MTHILTIANAKGGCAKTTTSINLGAALAEQGYSVLLIDNDPERHLSNSLGFHSGQTKYTLASLMNAVMNDMDLDDFISQSVQKSGVLSCIPSNHTLAGIATQLAVRQNTMSMYGDESGIRSEYVLKKITEALSGQFDYIIIDCGPALDLLTINALAASNQVIIPVQAHYLSEGGLEAFIEIVRKIRQNLNTDLEVGGVLITMYQGATNLCRSVQDDIRGRFGSDWRVFRKPIPHSIKVAESPAFKKSILEHEPSNPAAEGYREMAKEVLSNVKA